MIRVVLLIPVAVLALLTGGYLLTPRATLEMPEPGPGYLDAHAHIAGIGAGGSGCFVNPSLRNSYKFMFYLHAFGVSEDDLEKQGDELVARRINQMIEESKYVRSAVVLALDGVIHDGMLDRAATQIYVPNSFVAHLASKYPHLEYGASINPERPDWSERLHQAKRDGALLVKWLPAIMNIDPGDPRYIPYYRTLVKLDLPLLVHVGNERSFGDVDDSLGDPRKLELPLKEGVTVIAAHIATTGEYENEASYQRLLSMFPEHPNLYTDISSLTQINKLGYLVEALKVPGLTERMLYGSDWPLQFFPLVSPLYHWPDIDIPRIKSIQEFENQWDRDIALKTALGVPPSVLERSEALLLQ